VSEAMSLAEKHGVDRKEVMSILTTDGLMVDVRKLIYL